MPTDAEVVSLKLGGESSRKELGKAIATAEGHPHAKPKLERVLTVFRTQIEEGAYSVGRGNDEAKRVAGSLQPTWESPPPPPPKTAPPPNIVQPPMPPASAPTMQQGASSWNWSIEEQEDQR